MAQKLKNRYEVVLQQNNGYGWGDVETFEANSSFVLDANDSKELKRLKGEYKIAQPKSKLRVVNRRTPLK